MAQREWLRIPIEAGHQLADLAIEDTAAGVVGGAGDIRLPDFTGFDTARERARIALLLASGIEQALLVQYLYSAYSLTGDSPSIREARSALNTTAIEEMAHLMTVQNLLLLIRAEPSLKRTDRQSEEAEGGEFDAPVVPFNLMLEPFSKTALAKYIVAEAPHQAENAIGQDLYDEIKRLAELGHMGDFQNVGTLYLLMGVLFGDEETLNELATGEADGGFFSRAKALADFLVDNVPAYGGRDGIHLSDEDFAIHGNGDEFLERQGRDLQWDRSVSEADFRVDAPAAATAREARIAALRALEFISIQGEAATGPAADDSHFNRFVTVFKEIYGDTGQNDEPTGVAKVPAGSVVELRSGESSTTHPNAITNIRSAQLGQLADHRYAILLGSLEQYLRSPAADRDFLVSWCFSEMFHLKKLSQFLTVRARHANEGQGAPKAAVPFTLPDRFVGDSEMPSTGGFTPWPDILKDSFTGSIQIATTLLAADDDNDDALTDEEEQILGYMVATDRRKLLEAMARQNGQTARKTYDAALEVIEWAVGSGDPNRDLGFTAHGGKGRFWNRDIADFKDDVKYNPENTLKVLEEGRMPPDRQPLLPGHADKIATLRNWIEADECATDVPVNSDPVASGQILEIRILPPLAIGRMGSSAEPMDNYAFGEPDDADGVPDRLRKLVPAETLVVNPMSGEIVQAVVPESVRFRDGASRIRPVCPFLEVWARFREDGPFELLTEQHLTAAGSSIDDVRWSVQVGNLKMLRRTGARSDGIAANAAPDDLAGHQRIPLNGTCDNFKSGQSVPLGWAQYIKPNGEFPGIRLRFTPAPGLVYGHTTVPGIIPEDRAVYDVTSGGWNMFNGTAPANPEVPRAARTTLPGGIYARGRIDNNFVNLGYFDDACDGIVRVSIAVNGEEKTAMARISSGPPDFAPQHLSIRSVQDDLEQMALGPAVDDDVDPTHVIDIVQRAVETIRLLSTENENDSFPFWIPGAQQIFGNAGARYWSTRQLHEALLDTVRGLTSNDSDRVAAAVAALKQVRAILRAPRDTWNYSHQTTPGLRPPSQHMPALMRGGDGGLLALTERQLNTIDRAIEQFEDTGGDASPEAAMRRMIVSFASMAVLHGGVSVPTGGTLADLFANPDDLMTYLSDPDTVASGGTSTGLGFAGQRLVVPQDPAASALLSMVNTATHPMNGPLNGYTDSVLAINGTQVLENWINALPI